MTHAANIPLCESFLWPASLREDYLNQVQRDFLSRDRQRSQHP